MKLFAGLLFSCAFLGCEAPVTLSTDPPCTGGGLVCGAANARSCINPQSDPAHCGACGQSCAQGVACSQGRCCAGLSCNGRCLGGGFEDVRNATTGRETEGAYLRDLDRDGFDDLVAVNQYDATITVHWGNAQGQPGEPSRWAVGRIGGWLAFGDLDRDGMTDFVAGLQTEVEREYRFTSLGVFSLRPNRVLASEQGALTPETGNANEVALLDTDRDGALDLIARRMDTGCVLLRKGDGHGGLAEGRCIATVATGPTQPTRMIALDTERDGVSELLLVQPAGTTLLHFATDGSVARTETEILPAAWLQTLNHTHGMDLDHDGWPELVVVRRTLSDNGFRVDFLTASNGRVALDGCSFMGSNQPGMSGAGDFNGDGLPDLYGITSCRGCAYTASLLVRR